MIANTPGAKCRVSVWRKRDVPYATETLFDTTVVEVLEPSNRPEWAKEPPFHMVVQKKFLQTE